MGLNPTGTADPYGLRRHALAVIRILRAQGLHLDLPETVWLSLELLKDKLSRTPEETALEVLDFFQTRLQNLLLAEGFDQETVAAVLAAGCPDVVDAMDKVQALEEIRKSPDFPALAVAFKRVINISRGAEAGAVDELLFEYPEEKLLLEATAVMECEVAAALERRDYPGGLQGPGQSPGAGGRLLRAGHGDGRRRAGAPQPLEPAGPHQRHLFADGRLLPDHHAIIMGRWFRRKDKDRKKPRAEARRPGGKPGRGRRG